MASSPGWKDFQVPSGDVLVSLQRVVVERLWPFVRPCYNIENKDVYVDISAKIWIN
jgi:hypothetical protein